MSMAEKSIQTSINFFIGVLVIGLVGLLFLIVYGNLSGNLGFDANSTTITNESVALTSGIGTITDNTNQNFVSWNATLVINRTLGPVENNETLLEGTDYQIFSANGSIGGITLWNASLITYTVSRQSQAEVNSENVITNLTGGVTEFFTFADVWFILLAVTVLIGIVIGLLVLVMRIRGVAGGGGGKSNFTS